MAAWTCRQFAGKAAPKIVPLRSRTPCWKGLGADSEEKREPVSDIDAVVVESLKALDPNGRLEKLPFTTRRKIRSILAISGHSVSPPRYYPFLENVAPVPA